MPNKNTCRCNIRIKQQKIHNLLKQNLSIKEDATSLFTRHTTLTSVVLSPKFVRCTTFPKSATLEIYSTFHRKFKNKTRTQYCHITSSQTLFCFCFKHITQGFGGFHFKSRVERALYCTRCKTV